MPSLEEINKRCLVVCQVPVELSRDILINHVKRHFRYGRILDTDKVDEIESRTDFTRFVLLCSSSEDVEYICREVKGEEIQIKDSCVQLKYQKAKVCELSDRWLDFQEPEQDKMQPSTSAGSIKEPQQSHVRPEKPPGQPKPTGGNQQQLPRNVWPPGPYGPMSGIYQNIPLYSEGAGNSNQKMKQDGMPQHLPMYGHEKCQSPTQEKDSKDHHPTFTGHEQSLGHGPAHGPHQTVHPSQNFPFGRGQFPPGFPLFAMPGNYQIGQQNVTGGQKLPFQPRMPIPMFIDPQTGQMLPFPVAGFPKNQHQQADAVGAQRQRPTGQAPSYDGVVIKDQNQCYSTDAKSTTDTFCADGHQPDAMNEDLQDRRTEEQDVQEEKPRKIMVTNLPSTLHEGYLEMYFENVRTFGGGVTVVQVDLDEDSSTAIVEFNEPEGVDIILSKCPLIMMGKEVEAIVYKPEPPVPLCTVEVTGPCSVVSEEQLEILEMYFESERRSGGGDIVDRKFDSEMNMALITFEHEEVAKRVEERGNHIIKKEKIKVSLHSPTKQLKGPYETENVENKANPSKTIQVTGVCKLASKDTVEFYFENSRRSGGGEIENIKSDEEDEDAIYITFKSKQDAISVVKRGLHTVEGKELNVSLYVPPVLPPSYENKILIKGVKPTTTQDCLFNFIEAKTEYSPDTMDYHAEQEDVVMVNFKDKPDIQELEKIFGKNKLEGASLKVYPVPISNCIIVTNLTSDITEDTVSFYFENTRKSGGGQVDKVVMNKDDTCLVYFADYTTIDRVIDRKHELSKQKLDVKRYQECLGRPEGTFCERKLNIPEPLKMKNVSPHKLKLLKHSKFCHEALEKDLLNCHARVLLPTDGGDVTLKCTLTKDVETCFKLVKTWEKGAKECFDHFLNTISVHQIRVLQDVWEKVVERLKSITIKSPETVAVFVDENDRFVTVVGDKTPAESHAKKLQKVVEEAEMEQQQVKETFNSLKSMETKLLLASKFPSKVEEMFPELKVKINLEENEIVFEGSLANVRDAKLKLYEVKSEYAQKSIGNISTHSAELFKDKHTKHYIVKKLKMQRVTGVWGIQDHTLIIISSSEQTIDHCVRIIRQSVVEKSIRLTKASTSVMNSEAWQRRVENLHSQHYGKAHITVDESMTEVVICSTDDIANEILDGVKSFLGSNVVLEETVQCNKYLHKLVEKHHKNAISEICKQLRSYHVTITSEEYGGCRICGTEDGIIRSKQLLKKLFDKVKQKDHKAVKSGVVKETKKHSGQEDFSTIENSMLHIISVKDEWDEGEQTSETLYDRNPAGKENGNKDIKVRASCKVYGNRNVYTAVGDVTDMPVQVLVYAADEKRSLSDGLGKAMVLRGKLKADYIIHVIGPVWGGGVNNEEEKLEETAFKCMQEATTNDATSIALPAISCFAFGYPVKQGTRSIVKAVKNFFHEVQESQLTDIYLCDVKSNIVDSFTDELQNEFGEIHIEEQSEDLHQRMAEMGSDDINDVSMYTRSSRLKKSPQGAVREAELQHQVMGEEQEEEPKKPTKIVVSNLPSTAHKEYLEMIFENKRKFGDGISVSHIDFDEDTSTAVVEFNETEVKSKDWQEPFLVSDAAESKILLEGLCSNPPSHIAVCCVGQNLGHEDSRIRTIVITSHPNSYVYHLPDENSHLVKDGLLDQLLVNKQINKVFHDIGAVSASLIREFDVLMDGTPISDISMLFDKVTPATMDLEELNYSKGMFKKWTRQNEDYGKKMSKIDSFDADIVGDLVERGKFMWDLYRLCVRNLPESLVKKLKKEIFEAAIPSTDNILADKIKALKLEKKGKKPAEKPEGASQQQNQQQQQHQKQKQQQQHQQQQGKVKSKDWQEPFLVIDAAESKILLEGLCSNPPSHIAVCCVGQNLGHEDSRIRTIVITSHPNSYVYHLPDENSHLVKDGLLDQLLVNKQINKVFHDIGAVSASLIREFDVLMDGTPISDISMLFDKVTPATMDLEELNYSKGMFKKWTRQNEDYGKKMSKIDSFDADIVGDLVERGKFMWDLYRLCVRNLPESLVKKLKKEIFEAAIPSTDNFLADKIKALKLEKKGKKPAEKPEGASQQQNQQQQQHQKQKQQQQHQQQQGKVKSKDWQEPFLVIDAAESKILLEGLCSNPPSHIAVCCVGQNLGHEDSRIRTIVITSHPNSYVYHLPDENSHLVKDGLLDQLLVNKQINKVFHDIGAVSASLIREFDVLMDGTPISDISMLFDKVTPATMDLEELNYSKGMFKKWTRQNEDYGKKMSKIDSFDADIVGDLVERGKFMWDLYRLCVRNLPESLVKKLKKEIFEAAIPSTDNFLADKIKALKLEKKGKKPAEKPEGASQQQNQQQQQHQKQKQQQQHQQQQGKVKSKDWQEPFLVIDAAESKILLEGLCSNPPSHIAVCCVGQNLGHEDSRIRTIVITSHPNSYVYHLPDENSHLVKDGLLDQLLVNKQINKVFHDIGAVSASLIREFDVLMDGTPISDISMLFDKVTPATMDLEELNYSKGMFKKWTRQNEDYGKKMSKIDSFDADIVGDLVERGKFMWDLYRLCVRNLPESLVKKLKKEIFEAAIPSTDNFLADKIKALKLEKKGKKPAEKPEGASQQQNQQQQQHQKQKQQQQHQQQQGKAVDIVLGKCPIKLMGQEVEVAVYKPEPPVPLCTIEVTGPCSVVCQDQLDTLEMYFESERRSGGGDIVDSKFDSQMNMVLITFESEEDAKRVEERGNHVVNKDTLTVRLHTPSKQSRKSDRREEKEEKMENKPETSRTIKVKGVDKATSRETVEFYFENSRRSGGGAIEEVKSDEEEEDVIYITFKNMRDVKNVMNKRDGHKFEGKLLNVSLYVPPPSYENKILIKGLNPSTTEDCLFNFIEAKTGIIPETMDYHADQAGVVMVTFTDSIDFNELSKVFPRSKLEGASLKVYPVPISNCIIVDNLASDVTEVTVEFYFENTRKSGGGQVNKVVKNEDDTFLVYFADYTIIDKILQRKHELSKQRLDVKRYQECLGRPEGEVCEKKLNKPDPVELTDVYPQKLKFLKNSKPNHEALEKQMESCYAHIIWPTDGVDVTLECTLTKDVKDCFKLVKTWKKEAEGSFDDFLNTIAVHKISVLQDIWGKVMEHLKTISIPRPEAVAVFVDKNEGFITVVGNKPYAESLAKDINKILQKVTEEAEMVRQQFREDMYTLKPIERKLLLANRLPFWKKK